MSARRGLLPSNPPAGADGGGVHIGRLGIDENPVKHLIAHPCATVATLDGAAFSSGSTVSAEGDHLLVVTSTDAAGNTSTSSVPFSLDFTAPVIQLSGVTNGASGSAFTPVFSGTDLHSVAVSATLDAAALLSGTTVSAAGAHLLVVNAVDGAGNSASRTVHFTVTGASTGRPVFHFAVCAFGGLTVQNNALVDGRVWHVGAFTQTNNALAAGGHQQTSPAPSPCECGFNVAAALAAAAAANDNGLLAGNPALVNGVLTVNHNTTLTLAAGRYYFQSLEVKNNARLTTAVGAQVELFVAGASQQEAKAVAVKKTALEIQRTRPTASAERALARGQVMRLSAEQKQLELAKADPALAGSKKGSAQTLAELAGNDFDQSSLLIALLRAAGHPAQ